MEQLPAKFEKKVLANSGIEWCIDKYYRKAKAYYKGVGKMVYVDYFYVEILDNEILQMGWSYIMKNCQGWHLSHRKASEGAEDVWRLAKLVNGPKKEHKVVEKEYKDVDECSEYAIREEFKEKAVSKKVTQNKRKKGVNE